MGGETFLLLEVSSGAHNFFSQTEMGAHDDGWSESNRNCAASGVEREKKKKREINNNNKKQMTNEVRIFWGCVCVLCWHGEKKKEEEGRRS